MKIHEYQGKAIFNDFGVPIPEGYPAFSVDEAVAALLFHDRVALEERKPRLL